MSSHYCKGGDISDDKIIGVSAVDGRRGFRSQETIHSSSINYGVYCRGDQSGEYGRGGYSYQETSHTSSISHVVYCRVDQRGETEELDIGLKIPATLPLNIVITMVSLMVEVLECLWLMEDVDIGLKRPAILPL